MKKILFMTSLVVCLLSCNKMPTPFEDLGVNVPSLISPANKATISNSIPNFDWSDVEAAISYEIQVDNSSNFISPELQQDTLTNSDYSATHPLMDGQYYWRVRAKDADDIESEWSVTYSFTIDTKGAPPTLLTPVNGSTVKVQSPVFDWSDVEDAVIYELQVDNSNNFSSPELQQDSLTSSQYTMTNSLADGQYYWRVRAKNMQETWSDWSEVFNFITDTKGVPPVLLYPVNGGLIADHRPVFNWSDVSDALVYQLMVDNSSLFSNPEIEADSLSVSSFSTIDSLHAGKYYWKVRAKNNLGVWSDWSEVWDFTILNVQLIQIGTTIQGSLSGEGDVCYYKVAVSGSDALMFMFRGSTYTSSYDVKVYYGSISGSEVGVTRYDGNDLTVEVRDPSTGDYYVEVRNNYDGSRTFSLSADTRPVEKLSIGQQVSGQSLWGKGDVRYYKVAVSGSDALMFMFKGSTYASSYDMKVCSGSLSGSEVGVARSDGNDLTIEVTNPSTGDYYVEIRNKYDGNRTFSLSVDTRPVETLSMGQQVSSQSLWSKGDVRYYKVTVSGSDALMFMFRGSSSAYNYDIKVHYGSLSSVEVGVTRYDGNDLTIEVTDPSIGDYYVEIRNNYDGSRTFSLLVDTRPVETLNIGQQVSGQSLWGKGDVRYYKVMVSGSDALMFMLSGSSGAYNYDIKVHYGSFSSVEVGVKTSDGNDLSIEVTNPSSGDYYIEVRNNYDGSRTFDIIVNDE